MLSPIDMSDFAPSIPTSCSAFSSFPLPVCLPFPFPLLEVEREQQWRQAGEERYAPRSAWGDCVPMDRAVLSRRIVCLVLTDRLTID